MTRRSLIVAILVILCLGQSSILFAAGKLIPAASNGIDGQYLVQLHPKAVPSRMGSTTEEVLTEIASWYGGEVLDVWELDPPGGLLQITAADAQNLAGQWMVKVVEQNWHLDTFGGGNPLGCHPIQNDFMGGGGSSQDIDCTEIDPRGIVEPYDCKGNWGLDRIDQTTLPRDLAYHPDADGSGVTVFVIDTGIRDNLLEFGSRIHRTVSNVTIVNAPLDDRRFNTDDCIVHGHGTHVAGIIGSSTYGVAKGVTLFPVKFYDFCCPQYDPNDPDPNDPNACTVPFPGAEPRRGGTPADLVRAFDFVRSHAVPQGVANVSGANVQDWDQDSALVSRAQMMVAEGTPLVQSAGNQFNDDACDWSLGDEVPQALIVGGTDISWINGQLVEGRWLREGPLTSGAPMAQADAGYHEWCALGGDCGSNSGSCVDVWAPAAHIISTKNDGESSCRLSGTSMAAPHVTGAVALYLEQNPMATVQQVHDAIVDQASMGQLLAGNASPYGIGNFPNNRLLRLPLSLAPTATTDWTGTLYETPTTMSHSFLLQNDTDPDGGNLTVCEVGNVDHPEATVELGASTVTYTPPPGCTGGYFSFSYTVCDGQGATDVGLVWVDVGGIVCPPPAS